MLKFLMLVFAVAVFVLLAGQWFIHQDQFRWAAAAIASYMATSLPFPDFTVGGRRSPPPA
jgi:hypothetical protein